MKPLVDVWRGPAVESRHSGHAVVVDREGTVVFAYGDVEAPVFPRSAIKLLQALPLVTSGAAGRFGVTDAELALACSSHSGESEHVAGARSMLAKVGLDETCLECGGHWSLRQPVLIGQARDRSTPPGPICNNCSGKHAGFLAVCRARGWPVEGYTRPNHPLQTMLAGLLDDLTGTPHVEANRAVDGCSIPTYAVPLLGLARGFAKAFRDHPEPATRLATASMTHPFFTAGTDRFCTDFMAAAAGTAYAKTGAEGVYCGRLTESGHCIALKVADGASRASEVAFAALANAFLGRDDLRRFEESELTSWKGEPVGATRPAPAFRNALLSAAARTG